jgi:nesprin-1
VKNHFLRHHHLGCSERDYVRKLKNKIDAAFNISEALVRVRALIPMQLHLFHQILVQQESLEAGQFEIGHWLDEAEALLSSYSLAGGKEPVQALLDKHKVKLCSVL